MPPSDASRATSHGCNSVTNPMGELFHRQMGLAAGEPVASAPDVIKNDLYVTAYFVGNGC